MLGAVDSIFPVGRCSRFIDERPEAVVHSSRSAHQIGEMAVNQGKLSVGLVCAAALCGEAVHRRDQARPVGSRPAMHQKRLRRVTEDTEDLSDLCAADEALGGKTIIKM